MHLHRFFPLLLLLLLLFPVGAQQPPPSVSDLLNLGAEAHNSNDLQTAASYYSQVLSMNPTNVDALHLLGLTHFGSPAPDYELAITYITSSLHHALQPPVNPPGHRSTIQCNLGEVYRASSQFELSLQHLTHAVTIAQDSTSCHHNLHLLYLDLNDIEAAIRHLTLSFPNAADASSRIGNIYFNAENFPLAIQHLTAAVNDDLSLGTPSAANLLSLGAAYHRTGALTTAANLYQQALEIDPHNAHANLNLGVIFHESGDLTSAIAAYQRCLQVALAANNTDDTLMILNNLGAAQMIAGQTAAATESLHAALSLDPTLHSALINLGSYYAEEGELATASSMFDEAIATLLPQTDFGTHIRKAILLPPIMTSPAQITQTHETLLQDVRTVAALALTRPPHTPVTDPVSAIERVHFYLPYLGRDDDRQTQEMIRYMYQLALSPDLSQTAPHLLQPPPPSPPQPAPLRMGFVSKFFGDLEPHGLLLEGILAHLPRDHFYPMLFPIATSSRPPANYLTAAVAETVPLPLNFAGARAILLAANLDILVFADMNSEPMNHFLGYSRFAPVQCLFWGNPITSGHYDTIDYFISADRMEHPFRTKIEAGKLPYSEQVVLLDGQGIWYSPFEDLDKQNYQPATLVTPQDFHIPPLPPHSHLYLCAQSLFKLHPSFDEVTIRLLTLDPAAVIIFTEGRRPKWTEMFKSRLAAAIPAVLLPRVVFIPRVSSIDFPYLIALADVMLHPFPFGGSRTSLDGLEAEIPVVTFPQPYLRGRMAVSFFATMDIWDCCVAHDVTSYVNKAIRLGANAEYRAQVTALIKSRIHTVYNDMQVVHEWSSFLLRASGRFTDTLPEFVPKDFQSPIHLSNVMKHLQRNHIEPVPSTDPSAYSPLETFLHHVAIAYNSNGRLPEALDQLRLLERERPDDPAVHSDLGAILHQMWRLEEAAHHLEIAVEFYTRPGTPKNDRVRLSMNNFGVVLKDMGESDRALHWFLTAASDRDEGGDVDAPGKKEKAIILSVSNAANVYRDRGDFEAAYSTLCMYLVDTSSDYCAQNAKAITTIALLSLLEPTPQILRHSPTIQLVHEKKLHQLANSIVTFASWSGKLSMMEEAKPLYSSVYALSLSPPQAPASRQNSMSLMVQFFYDPKRERMAQEMLVSLSANAANPSIGRIFVFVEIKAHADIVRANLESLDKIVFVTLGERMTFAVAFEFANEKLGEDIAIFANADIILGELDLLKYSELEQELLALTRWEIGELKDGDFSLTSSLWSDGIYLNPRIDSQDTWIWRGSVPPEIVRRSDFYQGLPRCDQRIASIFRVDGGWKVRNPALAVKTLHVEGAVSGEPVGAVGGGLGAPINSYSSSKNVHGDYDSVLIDTRKEIK